MPFEQKGQTMTLTTDDPRHPCNTTPPPDEIARLIERARKESYNEYLDRDQFGALLRELASALSRLTTPPPDEIARLIERLIARKANWIQAIEVMQDAAAALRALAQESERLHAQLDTVSETYNEVALEGNQRGRRIRELEGIVAQIQPPADIGDNCTAELAVKCASLEAERDAIKRKMLAVIEWWDRLPPNLRQDIEGSGAEPGCIAAVRTVERIRELEASAQSYADKEAWFERNKHLFSEGMKQRWLECLYTDGRLRELEAERDGWKDRCERAISDRDRARITHDIIAQERDAIGRKTIEECVATKVTLRFFGTSTDDYLEGFNDGALAKTDAIRALAHSESEGKEESKE